MRCWDEIYRAALNNEMGSFYTASGYAYQFMMQLYNTLIEQTKTQSMSDVVQRCMALIQTEYKNELDLVKGLQRVYPVFIQALSGSPAYFPNPISESAPDRGGKFAAFKEPEPD